MGDHFIKKYKELLAAGSPTTNAISEVVDIYLKSRSAKLTYGPVKMYNVVFRFYGISVFDKSLIVNHIEELFLYVARLFELQPDEIFLQNMKTFTPVLSLVELTNISCVNVIVSNNRPANKYLTRFQIQHTDHDSKQVSIYFKDKESASPNKCLRCILDEIVKMQRFSRVGVLYGPFWKYGAEYIFLQDLKLCSLMEDTKVYVTIMEKQIDLPFIYISTKEDILPEKQVKLAQSKQDTERELRDKEREQQDVERELREKERREKERELREKERREKERREIERREIERREIERRDKERREIERREIERREIEQQDRYLNKMEIQLTYDYDSDGGDGNGKSVLLLDITELETTQLFNQEDTNKWMRSAKQLNEVSASIVNAAIGEVNLVERYSAIPIKDLDLRLRNAPESNAEVFLYTTKMESVREYLELIFINAKNILQSAYNDILDSELLKNYRLGGEVIKVHITSKYFDTKNTFMEEFQKYSEEQRKEIYGMLKRTSSGEISPLMLDYSLAVDRELMNMEEKLMGLTSIVEAELEKVYSQYLNEYNQYQDILKQEYKETSEADLQKIEKRFRDALDEVKKHNTEYKIQLELLFINKHLMVLEKCSETFYYLMEKRAISKHFKYVEDNTNDKTYKRIMFYECNKKHTQTESEYETNLIKKNPHFFLSELV